MLVFLLHCISFGASRLWESSLCLLAFYILTVWGLAMAKSSRKKDKKERKRKGKKRSSSSSSSREEIAEDPEDRKKTLAVSSTFGLTLGATLHYDFEISTK